MRYPFRTVSQFELVPAVPGASSVIGNDAGAVTAGFSGAITDAVGAGFARCDGRALRRGRGDAVFVGPATGGAVGAGVGKLALALNVVSDVCATVKLHA